CATCQEKQSYHQQVMHRERNFDHSLPMNCRTWCKRGDSICVVDRIPFLHMRPFVQWTVKHLIIRSLPGECSKTPEFLLGCHSGVQPEELRWHTEQESPVKGLHIRLRRKLDCATYLLAYYLLGICFA